jgi:hypothetical protein
LLYIYNRRNGIGDDTKLGYQLLNIDVLGHFRLQWEPRFYRMQVHLRLKMEVSDSKGHRGPMVNVMHRYIPNPR